MGAGAADIPAASRRLGEELMSGTSSSTQNTNQTSRTTPYGVAQPHLDSLLGRLGTIDPNLTGTETDAFSALTANAQAGNPFANQIGGVANTLLGGGPDRTGMVGDTLSQYQGSLSPFARGDFVDPSKNQALQGYLSMAGDEATKRVNAMYAGSGRDPAGAGSYAQNVGKGVAEATAPILYDAYNQARGQQLGAINSLFGAGTGAAGLLSGLDQTRLGNQQAGIGAASTAQAAVDAPQMRLLELEAQRRGIPMQNIASLLGPLMGAGQAFGTQNMTGTTTGTQTLSPAQQAWGWMQSLGSMFRQPQGPQPYSY